MNKSPHIPRLEGDIDNATVAMLIDKLRRDEAIHYRLADGGELRIDRALPFLCLYRQPEGDEDRGTASLITAQAAYLRLRRLDTAQLKRLLEGLAAYLGERFGGFLLLELWAGRESDAEQSAPPAPAFHLHAPSHDAPEKFLERVENILQRVSLRRQQARLKISFDDATAAPTMAPPIDAGFIRQHHGLTLGLEVAPLYRQGGQPLPYALRALRRELTQALKRIFYRYSRDCSHYQPRHYHQLGSQALSKALLESDRQLARISERFDLLLHVTPINAAQAWREFEQANFSRTPQFHYRPRSADPALLKRELYQAPLERIKDPTLADLFYAKREELDRQLTLLNDRNTPNFLYGSMQLFGQVDGELLEAAHHLIQLAASPPADPAATKLDAHALAAAAQQELDHYRAIDPSLDARVEVRDDITGILVSHGNFLIGSDARVSKERLAASLHHEIGTHALTYHNGKRQPLHQFYAGMAGYEELQEGLAVLAEYLCGGLSRDRLQLLAARVVAVDSISSGAGFVDTFERLHEAYGLRPFTAFTVTMRVFRGGGYTKDMIYLRGLMNVIKQITQEENPELLYCGKIALDQLPLLRELQWREVIKPIALKPRYFDTPEARQRLELLKQNPTLAALAGSLS